MADAALPADPRADVRAGGGWGLLLAALVAFLFLPSLFAVVVPVTEPHRLLLPALAALMVVGWLAGGSLALALAWAAVAVTAVLWPASAGTFDTLQRAWSVLLAGAFGLVIAVSKPSRAFVGRGVAAAAAAMALVVGLALVTTGGPGLIDGTLRKEYADRITVPATVWEKYLQSPEWARQVEQSPALGEAGASFLEQLRTLPAIAASYATVAPAMLVLQSLVALALAWALYHRTSRVPLGPPLASLRDFRFSDQLVWGLVVGFALVVVPEAPRSRLFGANVLVFFGALYALRGLGVLWWFLKPGRAMTVLLVLVTIVAFPVAVPAVLSLVLGLGVIDTWLDWRTRARVTPQSSE